MISLKIPIDLNPFSSYNSVKIISVRRAFPRWVSFFYGKYRKIQERT